MLDTTPAVRDKSKKSRCARISHSHLPLLRSNKPGGHINLFSYRKRAVSYKKKALQPKLQRFCYSVNR